MKVVQPARKCIYKKKKGYLLLELIIGFAVASIMLICVWSSFNTAMNVNKKSMEKKKTYSILYAIEKELDRNVSFDEIYNLKEIRGLDLTSNEIKNYINIDFIEEKLGELNGFYIDFSEFNELDGYINIRIYKENYEIEVNKFKCIELE